MKAFLNFDFVSLQAKNRLPYLQTFPFPRFYTTSVCYILTPNKWSFSGLNMQISEITKFLSSLWLLFLKPSLKLRAYCIEESLHQYLFDDLFCIPCSLGKGHPAIEVPTGRVSPLNKILIRAELFKAALR